MLVKTTIANQCDTICHKSCGENQSFCAVNTVNLNLLLELFFSSFSNIGMRT